MLKLVKNFLVLLFCVLMLSAFGLLKTPKAAYQEVIKKAERKDWGGVYDGFDQKTQKYLESSMRLAYPFMFPGSQQKVDQLSGRDLYIKMAEFGEATHSAEQLDPDDVVMRFEEKGDTAVIYGKHKDGTAFKMPMVKEGGDWKLSLIETEIESEDGSVAMDVAGTEDAMKNGLNQAMIQQALSSMASLNSEDEPNFISVNGQVIPNPAKFAAAEAQDDEPNFISVNGEVIPNPKKQRK